MFYANRAALGWWMRWHDAWYFVSGTQSWRTEKFDVRSFSTPIEGSQCRTEFLDANVEWAIPLSARFKYVLLKRQVQMCIQLVYLEHVDFELCKYYHLIFRGLYNSLTTSMVPCKQKLRNILSLQKAWAYFLIIDHHLWWPPNLKHQPIFLFVHSYTHWLLFLSLSHNQIQGHNHTWSHEQPKPKHNISQHVPVLHPTRPRQTRQR